MRIYEIYEAQTNTVWYGIGQNAQTAKCFFAQVTKDWGNGGEKSATFTLKDDSGVEYVRKCKYVSYPIKGKLAGDSYDIWNYIPTDTKKFIQKSLNCVLACDVENTIPCFNSKQLKSAYKKGYHYDYNGYAFHANCYHAFKNGSLSTEKEIDFDELFDWYIENM